MGIEKRGIKIRRKRNLKKKIGGKNNSEAKNKKREAKSIRISNMKNNFFVYFFN
ncbi:hypothetical protein [Maize bushy stunt phytoplasma]|uniref:hypothetical protein n=1 Tax=Maize bushy stunt phytoplasma TaxID=202462 RepID=UPI0012EE8B26|nr:hypothetical protein [Maize bushy stunt phytoplasma]